MKKFGFTLAEMVIAIAVVGVLAAASVPLVNSIIPDREKVQVLKAYKQIQSINQEIISNPSIYDPNDPNNLGFLNTDLPLGWTPNNNALIAPTQTPNRKYSAILADYLKGENYNNGTFTTPDGMFWTVAIENGGIIQVTVDVNGRGQGNNCSYDCNSPDRFIFGVTARNGRVEGIDPLTRAYLANPYRLSDRKNDYIRAQEFN